MKILDIGCGPADILSYMEDVQYWGFDISRIYIERARSAFGSRATFQCKELVAEDLADLPRFDVVLAIGLLHHLDEPVAKEMLKLAAGALKQGGRLITVDPCLTETQNPIARFLVRHDRGQNVLTEAGYENLAKSVFSLPQVNVRHQAWIPYTHCIMECQK